jgi:hypothetical protein
MLIHSAGGAAMRRSVENKTNSHNHMFNPDQTHVCENHLQART